VKTNFAKTKFKKCFRKIAKVNHTRNGSKC